MNIIIKIPFQMNEELFSARTSDLLRRFGEDDDSGKI